MGDRGQHLRLGIAGRGGKAGAVAFNWERAVDSGPDSPLVNLVVKLSRNEFRGNVEPQAKLEALAVVEPADSLDWDREFMREVALAPLEIAADVALSLDTAVDRRLDSPLAAIAELADQPDGAVVVVNDPVEWRRLIGGLAQVDPAIADIEVLSFADPELTGANWRRAVLAEPPAAPALAAVNADEVVIAWNAPGIRVIASRGTDLLLDRSHVVNVFRAIKDSDDASWSTLQLKIQAAAPSARIAGQAVRVLSELSLVRVVSGAGAVESIEVGETAKTELDLSPTFRSYSAYREESPKWLRQISADQ
jgi:hypothetical protein